MRTSMRALALASAVVLVGCSSGTAATPTTPTSAVTSGPGATPSQAAKPSPSIGLPPIARPSLSPAIIRELDAGGDGWAMTLAGGALWIQVDPPVDAIVRIDLATGASSPAVPGGWRVKSGSDAVWVVCCDWLAKVDPATGTELSRIALGGSLAVSDEGIWLWGDHGLIRVDPESGQPGAPVGDVTATGCSKQKDLVIAFDSAWLACKEGEVVRLDLETGAPIRIPTGRGAHTFTVADGSVWVTNYEANTVSRIEPATNEAIEIKGAGAGVGITSGGGFVWAAAWKGIAKIDPNSNEIVDMVDLGYGEYYELVWDDGHIWASTRTPRVLEIDPSR